MEISQILLQRENFTSQLKILRPEESRGKTVSYN